MDRITPTLLAMPLTTSMDTYAELISWRKDSPREYRYRISVNPLPKNARIRVLVMVPTMSRPMFIPERNSSRPDSWGLAARTSAREEAMPMVTSITAPRALMMMPPTSRPRRPMGVPVWRSCSKGSTSSMRRPSTRVRAWASSPNSRARAVPATAPSMAHTLFFCTPPTMVRLTTAT